MFLVYPKQDLDIFKIASYATWSSLVQGNLITQQKQDLEIPPRTPTVQNVSRYYPNKFGEVFIILYNSYRLKRLFYLSFHQVGLLYVVECT